MPEKGSKVMISDIDESNGNEVVRAIKDFGGESAYMRTDVSRPENYQLLCG